MIYSIETAEGERIVDNLQEHCKKCYSSCTGIGTLREKCPVDSMPKRTGILKTFKGSGFLCCGETKTTKLFRDKLENIVYAIPEFKTLKTKITNDISSIEEQRFKRVVHNLKSINAHSIQELYSLVPQEILTSNLDQQIEAIKKELFNNLEQSALTFLRMAKHNSHMKAEFSIYEKLFKDNPALNFRQHPIKKVILNVLHTFFIDFSDNNVLVSVADFNGKLMLDYESIHVALYHLIENTSKYVKPKSRFQIRFSEDEKTLKAIFDMESLHIDESELDKIYEEGYSGISVRKAEKQGQGIGMYRIKRLVDLNNAKIFVNAGKEIIVYQGNDYSKNIFTIQFSK